jgi:hypothetical protein
MRDIDAKAIIAWDAFSARLDEIEKASGDPSYMTTDDDMHDAMKHAILAVLAPQEEK